ncbi:MAG: PKD domain-containing protein [Janthinobacterium lividum]
MTTLSTFLQRTLFIAQIAVLSIVTACGGGGSSSDRIGAVGTQTMSATSTATSKVVANAGSAQEAGSGVDVVLNGSGSAADALAPVELSYSWQQLDGPSVELSNGHTATPMFKTPLVPATTVMTFALTVSAIAASATDKVSATISRDSPWGVAPSSALSYNPEGWLPAMAEAGVTSVRGFYAPAPPAQDGFAPVAVAGMSGVGILQWSSSDPHSLPVNDLDGWRRYVTAQVTRFKGKVKHWEVWNEPPNFTADRSPASYAKVVAVAFDAAKAVDASVQIGLAAKSNHVNYLAESIAAGAKDKFDFITLHPYEVVSMLPLGWEGQFMGIVPRVRQMLQAMNPAKKAVPVWFTEVGVPASSPANGGIGPDMQADVLTKIYTMAMAQGAARTFWFEPRDSEGLSLGLTTADGTKRPAFYAMRSLTKYLGTAPFYLGWTQPDNAYYGFIFKTDKSVVMVAWSRAGQSSTRLLPSDVTAVDPRTGNIAITRTQTITDAPVVLVAPTNSAQAIQWLNEAVSNASKAFPWNGDHSASPTVELVAGAMPNGVFMVNPPAVTIVDNVAEFDLEGRGSVSFAVDPAFLPYGSRRISITAMVRGHGTGDPGFNLKYESDVPIANTDGNGLQGIDNGWFNIRGTNFYEKTWVIPNARFVGMYGFNFSFDTDGPAHSQFSIARVVVNK